MPDARWWSERIKPAEVRAGAGDRRSEFERDRARILHSRAFRRLQAKTQVFPPSKKDFYRTRLTHSLECSQIGKSLALRLWPESVGDGGIELVESACLAHDIGHPPCGHQGEEAIRESIPFDANAQNIRVLTYLEVKLLAGGEENLGLNLTLGTLTAIIKYPFGQGGREKEYLYDEDVERLQLSDLLRDSPFKLLTDGESTSTMPFPMLLMEWADDIAYSTHDTEDGINAGFITSAHLGDENYRHAITARVVKKLSSMPADVVSARVETLADSLASDLSKWADPPAHHVKAMMDRRIDLFVREADRAATGVDDWMYQFKLMVPDEIKLECEFLKALANECVFRDPRVTRLEFKQKRVMRQLWTALEADLGNDPPKLFPRSWWRDVDMAKSAGKPALLRLVADYLSGMSDSYCLQMYSVLYDPDFGSAFITV